MKNYIQDGERENAERRSSLLSDRRSNCQHFQHYHRLVGLSVFCGVCSLCAVFSVLSAVLCVGCVMCVPVPGCCLAVGDFSNVQARLSGRENNGEEFAFRRQRSTHSSSPLSWEMRLLACVWVGRLCGCWQRDRNLQGRTRLPTEQPLKSAGDGVSEIGNCRLACLLFEL